MGFQDFLKVKKKTDIYYSGQIGHVKDVHVEIFIKLWQFYKCPMLNLGFQSII